MKRFVALLLTVIMAFSLCVPAFAIEKEESVVEPCGPQYHYKTVYGEPVMASKRKLVSGQSTTGTYLEDEGDFIAFNFKGKNNATVGVSFSLSDPEGIFSVSVGIDMGSTVEEGESAYGGKTLGNRPAGKYLLYLTKQIIVKPYAVFQKRSGAANTEWTLSHTGYTITDDNYAIIPELVYVGPLE